MLDTLLKLVRWLDTSVPATRSIFNLLAHYDELSRGDYDIILSAMLKLTNELNAIQLEIAESIDVHTVATSRTTRAH